MFEKKFKEMKKMRSALLLALLCAGFTVSCNKINDITSIAGNTTANASCLINGKPWSARAVAVIQFGVIDITGIQAGDGQTITLNIGEADTGTYSLGVGSVSAAAYKPDSASVTQSFITGLSAEATGEVHITSIDDNNKTISGTFSFTAVRGSDSAKKIITEGKFTNITFTGSLPVTSGHLAATINGNSWSTSTVLAVSAAGKLSISATKSDGSTIGFILPGDISTGTYNLTALGQYIGQYNKNTNTFYTVSSGTLTIATKTSTQMTGTFQFSATNVMDPSDVADITGGSFTVKL